MFFWERGKKMKIQKEIKQEKILSIVKENNEKRKINSIKQIVEKSITLKY